MRSKQKSGLGLEILLQLVSTKRHHKTKKRKQNYKQQTKKQTRKQKTKKKIKKTSQSRKKRGLKNTAVSVARLKNAMEAHKHTAKNKNNSNKNKYKSKK